MTALETCLARMKRLLEISRELASTTSPERLLENLRALAADCSVGG